ncbi:MAG: general secretion pathway protein GspK [Methylocystis sp.]|nr:MAG: general secretion pathway protein GspK [Methylocystis sp.]
MTTGRLRLQTAQNIASATQAGYIAEAVVNLSILALLSERDVVAQAQKPIIYDGAPRYCVFDGAAIAVAISDESGKIDLNAASPELLQRAMLGLGVDQDVAAAVAKAIVAFRAQVADPRQPRATPPADKPFPPKLAPFETVLELDQVSGFDSAMFRSLVPFVTVHSHSPGVDARTSPPALFAALSGAPLSEVQALMRAPYPNKLNRDDPRLLADLKQAGEHAAYTIHVEALLATRQTASQDAIIDMQPASGAAFAIREMRRGPSHYAAQLREMIATNGSGAPDC